MVNQTMPGICRWRLHISLCMLFVQSGCKNQPLVATSQKGVTYFSFTRWCSNLAFYCLFPLPVFPMSVVIHKRVIWFRRPVYWAICLSGSL